MAIFLRGRGVRFPRLQYPVSLLFKSSNHTLTEARINSQSYRKMGGIDSEIPTPIDISKWRIINASLLGIKSSMISLSCLTVVNILKRRGFDCYLVGGCVRDLILNRAPKDFDVITTADLKQIRQQFQRAQIIGKRFPICQVWIKGSVVEVSSFDTVAQLSEKKEKKEKEFPFQIPFACDGKDFTRWRDSMRRDFTVNSLFFDPFRFKIYDYANGLADLKSSKLRTLIPAHVSFEEDCARILRGLRIAARLNLSFSKDTEAAIQKCASSVKSLDQFRLMMEMNYMLSYGAAGPSILMLSRFNILRMLLPFQAEYLEEAHIASAKDSPMLMQLFFSMDKYVFCHQPAHCQLWIALLAFHTALVRHSQDPLIIRAFASVLYQGSWIEGIEFARREAKWLVKFTPEISESLKVKSDEELAEEVTRLVYLIRDSVAVLSKTEDLLNACSRFPNFHFSGLVFVPRRLAQDVAKVFDDLADGIETCETRRENFTIDYRLLGKGDPDEIKFVLGKIILDTLKGNIVGQNWLVFKTEKHTIPKLANRNAGSTFTNAVKNHQTSIKKDRKHVFEESTAEPKQKLFEEEKRVDGFDIKCNKSMQKEGVRESITKPKQETSKNQKRVHGFDNNLVNGIETCETTRESFKIDHKLLGKGDPGEMRFRLGKIILDALKDDDVAQTELVSKTEKCTRPKLANENDCSTVTNTVKNHQTNVKKDRNHGFEEFTAEAKKETSEEPKRVSGFDEGNMSMKEEGIGEATTKPKQKTSKKQKRLDGFDNELNNSMQEEGVGESATKPKQKASKKQKQVDGFDKECNKSMQEEGVGESTTMPKQRTSKKQQRVDGSGKECSNSMQEEVVGQSTTKPKQETSKKQKRVDGVDKELNKSMQEEEVGEPATEKQETPKKQKRVKGSKGNKPIHEEGVGESTSEPKQEKSKKQKRVKGSDSKDNKSIHEEGVGESTTEPKQEPPKKQKRVKGSDNKHNKSNHEEGVGESTTKPKQETSKKQKRVDGIDNISNKSMQGEGVGESTTKPKQEKQVDGFENKHNKSMQEERGGEFTTDPKQETYKKQKWVDGFDNKHNKSMQEGVENLDSKVASRDEMLKPERLAEVKDASSARKEEEKFGKKSSKPKDKGKLLLSSLFR